VRALGAFFPADGNFYALGGRASDDVGSDLVQVSAYDPLLDAWSARNGTFDDSDVNNMVGGVLNVGGIDVIVTVGGSSAGGTTASSKVRQYDPALDIMTPLANDPWPGNADGATLPGGAAVLDNKLYVFGGFDIGIGMVAAIYRFDPAAAEGSRWTEMTATLPVAVGYVPVASAGGFIYVMGGSTFNVDDGTLGESSDAYVYDPVADSIQAIAPMPRATGETRAVTQVDGSIWVLGGGRVAPNPSTEVDIYSPDSDSWSMGPEFVAARRNFATDVDPASGSIWATGGYDVDGTTPLAVNEQFDVCMKNPDLVFADGFDGP
jgi:N-acetylneuraminic acid mutarotase